MRDCQDAGESALTHVGYLRVELAPAAMNVGGPLSDGLGDLLGALADELHHRER
jgi:hypothetical protein